MLALILKSYLNFYYKSSKVIVSIATNQGTDRHRTVSQIDSLSIGLIVSIQENR